MLENQIQAFFYPVFLEKLLALTTNLKKINNLQTLIKTRYNGNSDNEHQN